MIKVTTQGGKTNEVEYKDGMNVLDACKAAGIKPSKKATISIDGKDATLKSPLKDGVSVVITPKVKNG